MNTWPKTSKNITKKLKKFSGCNVFIGQEVSVRVSHWEFQINVDNFFLKLNLRLGLLSSQEFREPMGEEAIHQKNQRWEPHFQVACNASKPESQDLVQAILQF